MCAYSNDIKHNPNNDSKHNQNKEGKKKRTFKDSYAYSTQMAQCMLDPNGREKIKSMCEVNKDPTNILIQHVCFVLLCLYEMDCVPVPYILQFLLHLGEGTQEGATKFEDFKQHQLRKGVQKIYIMFAQLKEDIQKNMQIDNDALLFRIAREALAHRMIEFCWNGTLKFGHKFAMYWIQKLAGPRLLDRQQMARYIWNENIHIEQIWKVHQYCTERNLGDCWLKPNQYRLVHKRMKRGKRKGRKNKCPKPKGGQCSITAFL